MVTRFRAKKHRRQPSVDSARMRNVVFQGRPHLALLLSFNITSCPRFFFGSSEDERQLPCCTETEESDDEEASTTTEETEAEVSDNCRQCSDEEAGAGR